MKTPSSYIAALLGLLAVALGYLAWSEHQDLAELRAASFSSDERADLNKRIWDSQKKINDLQAQLAGPPSARKTGNTVSGDGPPRMSGGNLTSNLLSRMSDPEAQKIINDQIRTQIERRYADLFARLNLPADKLAQFKNLLVERQSAAMDVLSAANDQGISDPQDFQKLVQSAQADVDTQIKDTLGADAFGQYQDFQQSQGVRNVVSQLESNLSKSTTPLSADQSLQMGKILAQTSPPSTNSAGGPFGGTATGLITDAAIAQAQGVLSAPQVQALQGLQQQQQAQLRLRQIMLQNQAPVAPASPTTKGP